MRGDTLLGLLAAQLLLIYVASYIYIYISPYIWQPRDRALLENTPANPGCRVPGRRHWRSQVAILRICCPIIAIQNFIQSRILQKAPSNHKILSTSRFVIHFWWHIGTRILPFFVFVVEILNHEKHVKNHVFPIILPFRDFTFLINFCSVSKVISGIVLGVPFV